MEQGCLQSKVIMGKRIFPKFYCALIFSVDCTDYDRFSSRAIHCRLVILIIIIYYHLMLLSNRPFLNVSKVASSSQTGKEYWISQIKQMNKQMG